jgi:D-glycero-D-manno-heptose 1,7-bisphosphate phosphatase
VSWGVFFDRDGVLTRAPVVDGVAGSPTVADEMDILPGAHEAVAFLRRAGAMLFVVTNQPDVGRGLLDRSELDAMHDHLRHTLGIDDIADCPHDGAARCACRKPNPGMIVDLATRWDIDLAASWTIGDRWVDIAAGRAAGTRTALVARDYSNAATSAGEPPADLRADLTVADVHEAAMAIVEDGEQRPGGSPS